MGLHEDTDTRAIDNFVVRLRRYIEGDPSHPKHLQTVREWDTGLWRNRVEEESLVVGRWSLVDDSSAVWPTSSPPTRGTGPARRCGLLIGEIFESDGGGEVGRGGLEADAHEILVAPRGQRIDQGLSSAASLPWCQNNRAGATDGPSARALGCLCSGLTRPAMADDIEVETGGNPMSASKVSVSCCWRQRLSTHCTGRGRQQADGEMGVLNQREERFSVAFSRELLACQLRSTTRPLPKQASSTHCSTWPARRRL